MRISHRLIVEETIAAAVSAINASRHANGVVRPLKIATSICRSRFTPAPITKLVRHGKRRMPAFTTTRLSDSGLQKLF